MVSRLRNYKGRFAKRGQVISLSQALAKKQAELAARDAGVTTRSTLVNTTLHPLFAQYVNDAQLRGKDPKTVSRTFYALRRLQAWQHDAGIGPLEATELTLKQYVAYLRSTVANSSAKTETEKIKGAYKFAVRTGMLDSNPAEYVETPRLDDRETETYSNEELRRVRAAVADDIEDLIFHGLVYTGMRRAEFSGLRWRDVDFSRCQLSVLGKGRKLRTVPLHPRLAEVLASRKTKFDPESDSLVIGQGGSTRNMNHRFAKLLARAGVDGGIRPLHRIRATVQCSLYEENVREDVIDKILGWAPKTIRQRYYSRVRDDTAYDAILRLYLSDPIERVPLDPIRPVQSSAA